MVLRGLQEKITDGWQGDWGQVDLAVVTDGARTLYKAQLGDTLADASRVFSCLMMIVHVPWGSGIALEGVLGFPYPGQDIARSGNVFLVESYNECITSPNIQT